MKRATFMDISIKNGTVSIKRAVFMDGRQKELSDRR